MALVLAVEPDQRQAALLARVIHQRVHAELVVVDSRDAAIAALSARVPDVILLTALLSPRDESEMVAHLRTLSGADHVQTHTIPQLASSQTEPAPASGSGGLLSRFRRKKESEPVQGCDPALFADEVSMFLARAAEMKAHAAPALINRALLAEVAPATDDSAETAVREESDPASSWSSPFEWRRADAAPETGVEARAEVPPPVGPSLVSAAPIAVLAEEEEQRREAEDRAARARTEAETGRERARVEAAAAAELDRLRIVAEAAELDRARRQAEAAASAELERARRQAEAAAKERARLDTEAVAERIRLAAVAAAERERVEAAAAAHRERARLEAIAAAEKERARIERIAAAKEQARLDAEAAAERERIRVEATAAAERKRVEAEAEAAAHRERARLEAIAVAEKERARIEAEAAAVEEQRRREAAAERERLRIEAAATAERERVRIEAVAAAGRERARLEAVAAAERERVRLAAEAAERERARLEAEAAAERERQRVEAMAAAERARLDAEAAATREQHRLDAEAEAARERLRLEAAAAERKQALAARQKQAAEAAAAARAAADPFADFRIGTEDTPSLLRLMPLAFWARQEVSPSALRRPASGLPSTSSAETPADDLRELMAALSLPPQVAGVSYARGCRIRRVRVATSTAPRVPGAPPLILSRRALEQSRAER